MEVRCGVGAVGVSEGEYPVKVGTGRGRRRNKRFTTVELVARNPHFHPDP